MITPKQEELDVDMAENGIVREDLAPLSRGFYITSKTKRGYYLHKDNVTRLSVRQPDGIYAFWDSEENAKFFLNQFKTKILKRDHMREGQ